VDVESVDIWASMAASRAEHEAGHVAVAFALGIGLVSASIDPALTLCDDEFTREVHPTPVSRQVAARAGIFIVAGKVYEQVTGGAYKDGDSAFPDPRPPAWMRSADVDEVPDDFVRAYALADVIAGADMARRTVGLLMTRAVRLLRRSEGAVKALATALRGRETMMGDELRQVWLNAGGQAESLPEYVDDVLREIDAPPGA
jgi:hypothetical protein